MKNIKEEIEALYIEKNEIQKRIDALEALVALEAHWSQEAPSWTSIEAEVDEGTVAL